MPGPNNPSAPVEQFVSSDGVRINVATAPPNATGGDVGSGRSVLLLHGFPDSWQLWHRQMKTLTDKGFRVIAPDLRGHGRSDRPTQVSAYRIGPLLADITAVLEHFGIRSTAVVGHDWGAALAWNLAMRRPDVVDRLAVLSVGHPGAAMSAGIRQRQLSWYMLWFLHAGVAESILPAQSWLAFRRWAWDGAAVGTDPQMDRQIDDLSRPGALESALNLYRANITPESYFRTRVPPMPRVDCPVLGVWSAGDQFLSEEQMTGSAAFVDGPWTYAKVQGGHWIPAQAPDELNAVLVDFLA